MPTRTRLRRGAVGASLAVALAIGGASAGAGEAEATMCMVGCWSDNGRYVGGGGFGGDSVDGRGLGARLPLEDHDYSPSGTGWDDPRLNLDDGGEKASPPPAPASRCGPAMTMAELLTHTGLFYETTSGKRYPVFAVEGTADLDTGRFDKGRWRPDRVPVGRVVSSEEGSWEYSLIDQRWHPVCP